MDIMEDDNDYIDDEYMGAKSSRIKTELPEDLFTAFNSLKIAKEDVASQLDVDFLNMFGGMSLDDNITRFNFVIEGLLVPHELRGKTFQQIRGILERNPEVTKLDEDDFLMAIELGYIELVYVLLLDINDNYITISETTFASAVIISITAGLNDVLRLLLDSINVNKKIPYKGTKVTSLFIAVDVQNEQAVYIITQHKDFRNPYKEFYNPDFDRQEEEPPIFKSRGLMIDALLEAIGNRNIGIVALLLTLDDIMITANHLFNAVRAYTSDSDIAEMVLSDIRVDGNDLAHVVSTLQDQFNSQKIEFILNLNTNINPNEKIGGVTLIEKLLREYGPKMIKNNLLKNTKLKKSTLIHAYNGLSTRAKKTFGIIQGIVELEKLLKTTAPKWNPKVTASLQKLSKYGGIMRNSQKAALSSRKGSVLKK